MTPRRSRLKRRRPPRRRRRRPRRRQKATKPERPRSRRRRRLPRPRTTHRRMTAQGRRIAIRIADARERPGALPGLFRSFAALVRSATAPSPGSARPRIPPASARRSTGLPSGALAGFSSQASASSSRTRRANPTIASIAVSDSGRASGVNSQSATSSVRSGRAARAGHCAHSRHARRGTSMGGASHMSDGRPLGIRESAEGQGVDLPVLRPALRAVAQASEKLGDSSST